MSRTALILAFLLPAAAACRAESARHAPLLPPATTPVSRVTFVAFDTETTGLDARYDRIVEIGAVKFRDGRILETKEWLINPRRRIPYWAEHVHGITTAMVRGAPDFRDVYPEFEEFTSGCVLFAHNARFDVGFVGQECRRNGISSPRLPVLDSLRLFRAWFPEAESHSLEPLVAHAKLEPGRFHRASDDSVYVALLFGLGLERLDQREPTLGRVLDDAGDVLTW